LLKKEGNKNQFAHNKRCEATPNRRGMVGDVDGQIDKKVKIQQKQTFI
tara:strand:- start:1048 stop:1191 length:144 start_codon:yes stop_codon:yes gene_type:complete